MSKHNELESFHVVATIIKLKTSIFRSLALYISFIIAVIFTIVSSICCLNEVLTIIYSNIDSLLLFPTSLLSIAIAVVAIAYGIFTEDILRAIAEHDDANYSVITYRLRFYMIIQLMTIITLYICKFLSEIKMNEIHWIVTINYVLSIVWVFWVIFLIIYNLLSTFHLIDFVLKLLEGRIEFYRTATKRGAGGNENGK